MKRTPLPPRTSQLKRSYIKKSVTPRATKIHEACNKALDFYFLHNSYKYGFTSAPCQVCAEQLDRSAADPAHLNRRWKGMHGPDQLLAAHRKCHTWMDARPQREAFARASGISCFAGGTITWSPELKASLDRWLKQGVDPIELGEKNPYKDMTVRQILDHEDLPLPRNLGA